MPGRIGSHNGRRLGILRTSRATVKGLCARLCITSNRRLAGGELLDTRGQLTSNTPLYSGLSVGISGDKVHVWTAVALTCPPFLINMTTLYSRMRVQVNR